MKPTWNQEIPQHWVDQGVTIEYLEKAYKITHVCKLGFTKMRSITALLLDIAICFTVCVVNYVLCWKVRKNINPMKLIGEIPMTRFEKYAFACQLGREPAINFVNSTLVTNDRAYIIIRLVLGLTQCIQLTYVGSSSPFRGLNYPMGIFNCR